jgi:hypothetical protein
VALWNWSVILTVKAQVILADMSKFSIQDSLAKNLLSMTGIVCLHKTTRAGATMSIVKACCESEKKVAVVVPTIKIIKEIETKIPEISQVKPKIGSIRSNPELCRKLNPNLKIKFQFKSNCWECEYNSPENCSLQRLLVEDYDVHLLTYDKLLAMQTTSSQEAKQLLKKIFGYDVFILDEFTTSVLPGIPTLIIKKTDENGQVIRLRDLLNKIFEESKNMEDIFSGIFRDIIDDLLDECESINESKVISNEWIELFSKKEIRLLFNDSWRFITKLTGTGLDTELLQDTTLVAFSRFLVVSFNNEEAKVTPKLEDALGYLREFFEHIGEDRTIFLVDSYQPTLNYSKVFDSVKHVTWGQNGDPLQTDLQQLVICDTAHWGSENFKKDKRIQKQVESFIKELVSTFPAEKILIVTTNKTMAQIITNWNLSKETRVTWFRSDLMRGVPVENRKIMVCVGGPYLPKDAYVPQSKSFNIDDLVIEAEKMTDEEKTLKIAQLLRIDDTCSQFVNAIGRVKDSLGEDRSLVFTLGMDHLDVDAMLRQPKDYPVSRPHVVRPYLHGGMMQDGLLVGEIWLGEASKHLSSNRVKDLPILARIIRALNEKPEVRASEVIHGHTKEVVAAARRNFELLKHYNIKIATKQGGYSFVMQDY